MLQKNRRRVSREDVLFALFVVTPAVVAALLVFTASVELASDVNDPLFYWLYVIVLLAVFAPATWSWYIRIDGRLSIRGGEYLLRLVVMGILAATVHQTVLRLAEQLDMFWRTTLSLTTIVVLSGIILTIYPDSKWGWRKTSRFSVIGWTAAILLLGFSYVAAVLSVTWEVEWWQVLIRVVLLVVMPVALVFAALFAALSQPDEDGRFMYDMPSTYYH